VLSSNQRHADVLQLVRREQPDLVVALEVTGAWAQSLAALREDYPHQVIVAREDNFGIACYSRLPVRHHEVLDLGPADLPSILLELELGERTVCVVATHPLPPISARHTRARDEQLEAIAALLEARAEPVVLVGDFNTTPWAPGFKDLLKAGAIRDTLAGRGWQPTWPAKLGCFGIPIDHCVVSEEWTVGERRVCPSIGGDHRPLLIELRLPSQAVTAAR
jgi:endonuclease/exonuclease/phosphatase (EEP) superfamily protein YafD